MRNFLWTCTLALLFVPFASAQDFAQLKATIDENFPAIKLDGLGSKAPSAECVAASKAVFDAATKIYALPDLTAADHQKILQREALALIVLTHVEPHTYYARLTLVSDEVERRGLQNLAKETEKHVLDIGGELVTAIGDKAMKLNIESLAKRMILYAEQYPGAESVRMLDNFLQRIRLMKSAVYRDNRLAVVAPLFHAHFQKINQTLKADALVPDMIRSTLPGQAIIWHGVDINGKDLDRAALKDKVVLIQFWGTWCVNCKEEMPDLVALYDKYHDKGFEIIGINTAVQEDSDVNKVKQFLNTKLFGGKKIPWTILHEGLGQAKNDSTMTKMYGIEELPIMILVGKDGKVMNLHPSPSTLDELVGDATSIFAGVLTEEDKRIRDEVLQKQQEAAGEQIRQ